MIFGLDFKLYLNPQKDLFFLFLFLGILMASWSFAEQKISVKDLELDTNSSHKTISMNLTEAILLGLRHNRQIKSLYMDRVLEKFNLARARRKFHPNVTLDGDLNISTSRTDTNYEQQDPADERRTKRSVDVTPKIVQSLPTGGELTLKYAWGHNADRSKEDGQSEDTWQDEGQLSASFSQPLLKGAGTDYNTASLKKTRLDTQEAILSLRDNVSSQVLQIIGAYNSLWSAQENLKIARNSLQDARKQLKINKLLIETGRKPESDMYQAEANVARQELNYQNAINSLDQARLELLDILDLDRSYAVKASEEYTFSPKDPQIERCLKIAKENNTSLITRKNAVRRNELDLIQAKRDQLWDLSLDADYTQTAHKDSEPGSTFDKDHWKIGLNLKIPLFFWGQSKYDDQSELLSARINLDKSRLAYKEAQEDLHTQILNKVRNVRHAAERVDLSSKSRELSQKNYEMDELKLRLGRITNNDFIDSQERLSEAKQNEVEAIINYLNQVNDLDNFLGTLLKTYEVEFEKSRPALEKKYLQDKTWMLD